MLELIELGLVLVEPFLKPFGFGIRGGDRGALGQTQLDIEFQACRIREELFLYLAHAKDRQCE